MEIILNLAATQDGRLSGTVTRAAGGDPLSFSGTLELFARLEQLLDKHNQPQPAEPGSMT